MDLAWWIAVIGVPLVGTVFAVDYIIHTKAAESARHCHGRIEALTKEFGDYKVQSAMLFAQVAMVRELKNDMVDAMRRIEDKLDLIEIDLRRDRNDQRHR